MSKAKMIIMFLTMLSGICLITITIALIMSKWLVAFGALTATVVIEYIISEIKKRNGLDDYYDFWDDEQ